MGIRVEFCEVPGDDIREVIVNDFEKFKSWYLSIAEEYPDDPNYDILEAMESISNPGELFGKIDPRLIDELVGIYIGDYCDYGPGKMRPVKDSTILYIKHYENEFKLIEKKCTREVVRLWRFILSGRSIVESKNFEIFDEVFRYSFFSESECQLLLKELSAQFDVTSPEKFNQLPGIGSVIEAIKNKRSDGLLITVA